MTVQADDAGWGDLLGGVVIAAYRVETGEFAYKVVDVKFFYEPTFDQKLYLNEASKAALELLAELKTSKKEPVQLCTGYVLSEAVETLRRLGFNVSTGKITGPLQELGEKTFLDELRKIGYTPMTNREADGRMRAKSFYDMLNWMKEKPERRQYAKTGWSFFTGKTKHRWGRWNEEG